MASIQPYKNTMGFVDGDIAPELDLDSTPILLELLKREGPIVPIRNGTFGGVALPNNFLFPEGDGQILLVLGREEVKQALFDNETFSAELAFKDTVRKAVGKVLPTMDNPEHRRYKKMVMPAFTHRMVNEELMQTAQPIIERCLDEIVGKGEAELIAEFTDRFPYLIVAKLLGVPESIREEVSDAALNVFKAAANPDPEARKASLRKQNELYQAIVDDHKENPRDDMISQLLQTETDGELLSDDEVLAFIKMIMNAGLDTSSRTTAILIKLLLDNPEQFELLKRQPELVDQAVWEAMRICPTSGALPRVARKDTELGGVKIPAGTAIYASLRTPNFDEEIWPDPDVFDITRPQKQIMTFGVGSHACLGQSLSQAEIKYAMLGVLERMPNLRKDENRWEASNVRIRGFWKRSPNQLPVRWDV